jgi:DNA-binding MarR family transcriptional regulator
MFELIHLSKRRFMAIASEFDLSPPQVMALRQLDPDEPKPMSELAIALRCDNSNVTGIVDRLEDRGLVERRPAEHDRRVKMLLITERGAQIRAGLAGTSRPRRWPTSRPRTSARCATSCAAPSVAPDTLLRIALHCAIGARRGRYG